MDDVTQDGIFLSIIINCYNYERFVGEAIESALAASDADCEIIVVDDGSTDGSLDIIRSYENVQVVQKENGGQASALNAGFKQARGRYVHFLDADDLLLKDAVKVIRDTMPGQHLMWYAIEVLDEDLGVVSYYPSSRVPPERSFWSTYFGKGAAWLRPMSGNVFSRELLSKTFPLPEGNWRICADHIALCLAALYTDYQGSNQVINQYRFHGDNLYFSNTLSSLDTHIYEDPYFIKNSTHYRHFFVAGCDCLMRVSDPERYAAVLNHWLAFGEKLKEDAELLETHYDEISEASDRLLRSQRPSFWQVAAQNLFRTQVDPLHLSAFHVPPEADALNPQNTPTPPPFLEMERELTPDALATHFQGGFKVWNEISDEWSYSLSQACRFRAAVNRMSGVFRFSMTLTAETVYGDVRIVNCDGRIAEVKHIDDAWLADIPCSWVINGVLEFYLVFEALGLPQADEWSSFDTCLTGGYLRSCKFQVPPASHFYKPLHLGETLSARTLLSPVRHLANQIDETGPVTLSRTPTYFGMSLPFKTSDHERLVFDVQNTSDAPCAIKVVTDFADLETTRNISDQIVLPSKFQGKISIPIGFELFAETLPEVALSLLASVDQSGQISVRNITLAQSKANVVHMPPDNSITFGPNSIAGSTLGKGWLQGSAGIVANSQTPEDLVIILEDDMPKSLLMRFEKPRRSRYDQVPNELWVTLNGRVVCCPLCDEATYRLDVDTAQHIAISGWWSETAFGDAELVRISTQRAPNDEAIL